MRLNRNNDFELVIFDCDGVLVDSEMISARILIGLLNELGLDVDLAHVQRYFLGRSWTKVAAEIRTQYGLDLDSDFEERYRETLLHTYETELSAMDGIEKVLNELNVQNCVATSSTPKRVTRTMELSGLDIYFGDRLFTASQVKNGKPAPDLFLLAAEMLNVPCSSCLVIEDSIPGVVAAQAAGMEVWWFNGGSHLQGITRETHKELRDVKSFDNWAHFFDMAPELKKQTSKLPEVDEQPTR